MMIEEKVCKLILLITNRPSRQPEFETLKLAKVTSPISRPTYLHKKPLNITMLIKSRMKWYRM
jgi:hypothetical protein